MRKQNVLLYAIVTSVVSAVVAPSLAQDEIRWLDNYDEAIREAKRTEKPVFLEFRCEP
jgi:hypothetical protein